MAGLSARQLQAIHDLLRERRQQVPLNDTWRRIHRLLEVGEVRGRHLHFDPSMLRLLREAAACEAGPDLLAVQPAGNRRETATLGFRDEKQAPQRPDDGFVLVKGRLPAPLPVLTAGLSLRVPLAELALSAIGQVLVIENLDSFDQWQDYRAPPGLEDSLVLYRGHAGLARGARRLLAALPTSVPVTVFPDYDPAGLAIALSLPRADALLLPTLDPALLALGSAAHFQRQYRACQTLDGAELGGWAAAWATLKHHGVSLKQQHMLALGSRLIRVERR